MHHFIHYPSRQAASIPLARRLFLPLALPLALLPMAAQASEAPPVADSEAKLLTNTQGKGFGPQSPRDLSAPGGSNARSFEPAPGYSRMNLCNIHFHAAAEHRGGDFTTPAERGGFRYSGSLSPEESRPIEAKVCKGVAVGDTIEVHYAFSTAKVAPGPTLKSCLSEALQNPQLRVEAQVMVLVNDPNALDFTQLTATGIKDGYHQALHLPENQGIPIEYAGSTTGPQYNEQGSPLQVTWRVRPLVQRVDINSLGRWCQGNVFEEDHAHGVRQLVKAPQLLSEIKAAE